MGLYVELEIEDQLQLNYPHNKMGILGGTFDPIHNGHIDMAMKIKEDMALDDMMLLPCGNPPHKPGEEITSKQKRFHMAALCAFETPGLMVSDFEIKREGYSYTVDTLKEFHEQYKDTDFYFIIGSDTLFELESWKDFPEICMLTEFICVRRTGDSNLRILAKIAELQEKYDAAIILSEYTGLEISSSDIRERVKNGETISGMVPLLVEEYIIESGLYQ